MAKVVIKKDGSREPFDAEKLKNSIRGAGGSAGLKSEEIKELVEKVSAPAIAFASSMEVISIGELRSRVLAELKRCWPDVSAAWIKYEAEHKKPV